jgi:hypothetical protein
LILNDHPTFDGAFIIQIVEPQELNKMLSGWRVQNDTTWRDEYIIFAERNGDVLFVIPKISHLLFMVVFKKEIFYFQFVSRLLDAFCSAIEIEQSKYDGDATDDDFNFREDFLEDIDLMLKASLRMLRQKVLSNSFWLG